MQATQTVGDIVEFWHNWLTRQYDGRDWPESLYQAGSRMIADDPDYWDSQPMTRLHDLVACFEPVTLDMKSADAECFACNHEWQATWRADADQLACPQCGSENTYFDPLKVKTVTAPAGRR
jgi:DNA-directed RNA polymerase subunit RPC12/RpoP